MFYEVTALGELLIDFTPAGTSAQGNPMLEANPGGAPCNVLSMLTRLGHSTAFIGKVGADAFGDQLEAALTEVGIATEGLKRDHKVNTTLAFVHKLANGDRSFSFYREPGADMMLGAEDLNQDLIDGCKIFHFGTLSMTHEICREATRQAVTSAKAQGKIITFDPNLRESLWNSLDEAKEQVKWGLTQCDVLKISDNEIVWLTGEEDYDAGVAWIRKYYPGISLILVSMGPDGSRAYYGDIQVEEPAVLQDNTVETTGAGDTFCACVLHDILVNGLKNRDAAGLSAMLKFANAAASIVTTRKGALRVMPTADEVQALLAARS